MITPRGGLILVSVLMLLAASAAVGFYAHQRYSSSSQLGQPGWCCVPQSTVAGCTVSQGSDACQKEGGVTFNWDQQACNAACKQARNEGRQMKPRTP